MYCFSISIFNQSTFVFTHENMERGFDPLSYGSYAFCLQKNYLPFQFDHLLLNGLYQTLEMVWRKMYRLLGKRIGIDWLNLLKKYYLESTSFLLCKPKTKK